MQMLMFETAGKKPKIGIADCANAYGEVRPKPAAVQIDRPSKLTNTERGTERNDEDIDRWDGLY